jgi:ribosomal protein S18 acetylase RimI-like enzyme
MKIRSYLPEDEQQVIALWHKCELVRPWNNPQSDIRRKLKVNPELFLVGVINERIVATAMAGYEGHRAWVNYLAVDPACQRRGLGRQIMQEVEEKLLALGCPKINLQVRKGNLTALKFYQRIGYMDDEVVGMGKRIIQDTRNPQPKPSNLELCQNLQGFSIYGIIFCLQVD